MSDLKIVVVGLGYVGLPLAVALARNFKVIGFDIDPVRIQALQNGIDKTQEVESCVLKQSSLKLTERLEDTGGADLYIVTVPTPVTPNNAPDIRLLEAASSNVGRVLGPGSIVVFESTVYPGVTEEICGPLLEKASGLKAGVDFFLGYSPERMNPGDRVHTVEKITKVVAAQTKEATELLQRVYGSINENNIFCAASIKTAEAAKVIENAQRDINVAFMNEVAQIMYKLNLSTYDVLEAAQTKWNFLPFHPGLVGGHCIGVDPYYLAHCAQLHDAPSQVILSGRMTNESMGPFFAECLDQKIRQHGQKSADILVLGLTFKENVPDIRNSKVIDVISSLSEKGHRVDAYDPYVNAEEAKEFMDIDALPELPCKAYDVVVLVVPHQSFQHMSNDAFSVLVKPDGLIADLRGVWRDKSFPEGMRYWQL